MKRKSPSVRTRILIFAAAAASFSSHAFAGYAEFYSPNDTISLNGHTFATNEMTIEAEVMIPSSLNNSPEVNRIFSEQYSGEGDKWLAAWEGGIGGSAWSADGDPGFGYPVNLSLDSWHDVAFVRDQDEQRLYLDGSLIATRDLDGTQYNQPIGNSDQSLMSIGAFAYSFGEAFSTSFIGDIAWIRVDATALYSGGLVTVPTGVPAPDSSTQLLLDFTNVSPGSTTVPDLSNSHFVGSVGVGVGFTGTSPTFVDTATPEVTLVPGQSYSISAGSATGLTTVQYPGITISPGAFVAIAPASNHSNRQLLVVTSPGLSIAGATGNWTGLLDLANNDMDLPGASLATVTDQIRQGYNGNWNGSGGIISSSAAADTTHLTALGVIQNNQGGSALFTTFDGSAVGASDVLVKYTYYGDTDLSGVVDGSDYSRIDNAFLNNLNSSNPALTGWFNGDFNYDGAVNGSDYTLIDNALNNEGAGLTAAIATNSVQIAPSSSAVPEPVALSLLPTIGVGMLGRRFRRR